MKQKLLKTLPWVITLIAIWIAFGDLEWGLFFKHLKSADSGWIILAILLTALSYMLRARRWEDLFPQPVISYWNSFKVLILGFFMNNILPARTGELVRAHLGAKVTNQSRTLVLATVASERLADGLTLSLFFILFAFHPEVSKDMTSIFYVACFFGAATLLILCTLFFRSYVYKLVHRLGKRFSDGPIHYTMERVEIFIESLTPLFTIQKIPRIALWSLLIWSVELCVYFSVAKAFSANLSLALCVLFLVAVNFSSLIPAAPGGIGVIEAVASAVLVSAGVQRELALPMVISQHVIQILVVGIPGAIMLLTWKKTLKDLKTLEKESAS